MKRLAILCIFLQIVLSGLYCAAFYWLGHEETLLARGMTSTDLFLPFVALLFLAMFAMLIRSFVIGEARLWMIGTTFVYLAFLVFPMGINRVHRALLVEGLRDRVVREYGLDAVRSFARDVTQNFHPKDSQQGYYSFQGNFAVLPQGKLAAYAQLKEQYPFLKWKGDGASGPSVAYRGDVITVYWGDTNEEWGISVNVNGKRHEAVPKTGKYVLRPSDDIYFYAY